MALKRGRKVVVWIVSLMAAAVAFVVGDAHWRASRTFERHRGEVARLLKELHALPLDRPSIYGEAASGDAWAEYAPVLEEIKNLPEDVAEVIPEVDGSFEVDAFIDDQRLNEIYAHYWPQIARLRKGLTLREVDKPFSPEGGFAQNYSHVSQLIRTSKFLAGGVTHHHRLGNDAEALELAAILLALAQDGGRRGLLIEALIQFVDEGVGVNACHEVLAGNSLGALDLERFARRLDVLDRTRPSLELTWRVEDAYVRNNLLQGDSLGQERIRPTWRHLFSDRIMRAQALNGVEARFREIYGLSRLPAAERQKRKAELDGQVERETNPVLLETTRGLTEVAGRDLVSRMNLVLLRVSVGLAWYEAEKGAPPAKLADLVPRHLAAVPVCPLTDLPLCYSPGKVWSPGPDRVDDGGVPDPDGELDPSADAKGVDVVWTVKRR